jgi:hypothetical protein
MDSPDRLPVQADFDALAERIKNYFVMVLQQRYANDPLVVPVGAKWRTTTAASGTDAESIVPGYNAYLEFSWMDFYYTKQSIPPDPAETLNLMKEAVTPDFILNVPRGVVGTPFVTTVEALLKEVGAN